MTRCRLAHLWWFRLELPITAAPLSCARSEAPPNTLVAAEGYRPDRPFKPDPTMAFAIMDMASEKLGVTLTPDQCVYVGDSDVDYYTAVNAGMHPVSVSWGYRSHEFLQALGDQPVAATTEELWDVLTDLGV